MLPSNHGVFSGARPARVGIFDHVSLRLGGSQLVVAAMAAQLSNDYSVDVVHSGKGYSLASLAEAFGYDVSRVNERIVPNSLGTFSLPGLTPSYVRERLELDRRLTEPYDLFIYSGHGIPPFCAARHGMVYCHFPFEWHPSQELSRTEGWDARSAISRLIRMQSYTALWHWRMRGYRTVIGNSKFTSSWIEKRWKRAAEVIYPPVAVTATSLPKENTIVSLGRFIVTDGKNHALQLETFRKFVSMNGRDWRLCLIGFCTDLPQDRAYLDKLKALAADLPVSFVVNASRDTVWRHLEAAKLYWHATALSSESDISPERMEHFGIATVEAMGVGCVPLVPMSGGQPEIVEHGVSGFLCKDAESLLQHTNCVASSESLCQNMGQAARERSAAFRPEIFNQRLSQLAVELLQGGRPMSQLGANAGRPGVTSVSRG